MSEQVGPHVKTIKSLVPGLPPLRKRIYRYFRFARGRREMHGAPALWGARRGQLQAGSWDDFDRELQRNVNRMVSEELDRRFMFGEP